MTDFKNNMEWSKRVMCEFFSLLLFFIIGVGCCMFYNKTAKASDLHLAEGGRCFLYDDVYKQHNVYDCSKMKPTKVSDLIYSSLTHIKKVEGCGWYYDKEKKQNVYIQCDKLKTNDILTSYKKKYKIGNRIYTDPYTICFGNTLMFGSPVFEGRKIKSIPHRKVSKEETMSLATCEAHFKQKAFYEYYKYIFNKMYYKGFQYFNLLKINEFVGVFSLVYNKGYVSNKFIDCLVNYLMNRSKNNKEKLLKQWKKEYKNKDLFKNRIKVDTEKFFEKK